MKYIDLHTHTTYCDGKNTPEEMIIEAINKKMDTIGLLFHSYTFFDESYCISKDKVDVFIKEINNLKIKYSNRINILLGVEKDFYSLQDTSNFDYIIGSVHYLKVGENYLPIDESLEQFKYICNNYFNGNYLKFAIEYFNTIKDVYKKTRCKIIGHFDLITKYNEKEHLIDETNPLYINAWKDAIDGLVKENVVFEINLGGISRGYKTNPYPSYEMISYIKSKNGKLILSSDAHQKENLIFDFDKYNFLLEDKHE